MEMAQRAQRALLAAAMAAAMTASMATSTPDVAAQEQRPVLYLTFDDGPSLDSATPSLLALLAEHGVTATFFVVGENVDKNPAAIEGIIAGGHGLGNHTLNHVRLTELPDDEIRRQLTETQRAVDDAGGPTMTCYRPPFGGTDERVHEIAASLGMSEELWSLDPHDYERLDPQRYADTLHGAVDGDVVLLHDGFVEGEVTVEAVRRFLEERRDDFEFQAMPGCVDDADPTQPSDPEPATTTTILAPEPELPEPELPEPELPEPEPACRFGPRSPRVDASDATHGLVFRLYCSHLGRQPDDVGFDYWVDVVVAQRSARSLADWFVAGEEFRARFDGATDEAFLTQVYANVLGRSPDAAGRDYWLDILSAGASRAEVTFSFSESTEFRASTKTG